MENPYLGRKVWFFTGSQDLYGPDVLLQVEEQSRQVVADLNASDELPFEIEWRPILKDRRATPCNSYNSSTRAANCWTIWLIPYSPPPFPDRPSSPR